MTRAETTIQRIAAGGEKVRFFKDSYEGIQCLQYGFRTLFWNSFDLLVRFLSFFFSYLTLGTRASQQHKKQVRRETERQCLQ